MVVGYSLGIILIPKILSQRKALLYSALLGIIFTIMVIFPDLFAIRIFEIIHGVINKIGFPLAIHLTPAKVSVFCVAILGFANAIVWPAIWPLAIHDLGKFIKTGSALLIMAIAGGALLPLAWGWWSDHYTSQQAYWILFPCYLIIFLYASWWYKLRSWK